MVIEVTANPTARTFPRGDAMPVVGGSWLPTMVPPEYIAMAQVYLSSFDLGGLDVGTRLPGPDDDPADYDKVTVDGFIRVEGIGCIPANELEFDCDIAFHTYHPDEITSGELGRQVMARAGNAQGSTIRVTFDDGSQEDWYVGWSRVVSGLMPQEDPTVNLFRYRCLVHWRVPGHELQL